MGWKLYINPVDFTDSQFDTSVKVTALLKGLIIAIHQSLAPSPPDVHSIKADIHNHHCSANKAKAQELYTNLSQLLGHIKYLNSEDSSSWLTVLLFHDQGLHLNSGMLYILDKAEIAYNSYRFVEKHVQDSFNHS